MYSFIFTLYYLRSRRHNSYNTRKGVRSLLSLIQNHSSNNHQCQFFIRSSGGELESKTAVSIPYPLLVSSSSSASRDPIWGLMATYHPDSLFIELEQPLTFPVESHICCSWSRQWLMLLSWNFIIVTMEQLSVHCRCCIMSAVFSQAVMMNNWQ